jgi:SAM-dependent methyltransferase
LISNWREFWDRPHRIYVNGRHREVHYRQVAADIIAELPHANATVLDYGCGEALEAGKVAAACGKLILCESGPSLRADLESRFKDLASVTVLAPEYIESLPEGALDLVVANSVLQYLTREESTALAMRLRPKLAPGGRLILADIVPPDSNIVADVSSLLSTAIKNGFFIAALIGLLQTFVSDYRRLRSQIGLTTYRENEMHALLEAAGYTSERRARNFGFNPRRMTFIARRR